MKDLGTDNGYLAGQILIAMPSLQDPRFARTIVYVCAHTPQGAMGLVINRLIDELSFPELLQQIGISAAQVQDELRVHRGGPVEPGRGFVLHSTDYRIDGTLVVDDGVALTASVDILKAIAEGRGPRQALLALGYAGWRAGQLESEIQTNSWLSVRPDAALVFDEKLDTKWERAMSKLGVDAGMLSGEAGHA
jgi:putative transcriptional regulator